MSYKHSFIKAYHESAKLGLEPENRPFPLKRKLSKKQVQKILQICADYLYSIELNNSSDLASKCIPVHMALQALLWKALSVESYITIGDRVWSDYTYCEMSYEYILQEIEKPNISDPLKAHVWLTLCDGSVLDCTGEAHMDLLLQRGDYPTHKCLVYFPPDKNVSDGFYRPFLVGRAFLTLIGAYDVIQN